MALFFYQFTPLYGHNRKFLTIMLGIYGQPAVFAHFVRNRHFSSRSFTDKVPIFIDLSVTGRAFAKCIAR